MRITFVQCPQKDRVVPLGILCLATYVKQHGHSPVILDFNIMPRYRGRNSSYFIWAAKKIIETMPNIIGFSVICNILPISLLIAKACKKLAPQIPIVFGGPDVSFEEVELLRLFKQIDLVVRGEGENTLIDVLRAFENKSPFSNILGISFREGYIIKRNPDRPFIKNMDDLPFLDFSLLPSIKKYQVGVFEAGRGCPFHCTFCSTCKMWKRIFRVKSAKRIARELRRTYRSFKQSKNPFVFLVHDNFLASRRSAEEFLSLMRNKNIPWACEARLDTLDENLIKELKLAGCRWMFIGVESASRKIQKEIGKNLPLNKLPLILELLGKNDIPTNLSFILGFPEESESQLNQTLRLALKLKLLTPPPTIRMHLLRMCKGSEMYETVKDDFKHFITPEVNFPHSPTQNRLELKLIKKYPPLFPSFFFSKTKSLEPALLQKMCSLFNYLIDYFPQTTWLLLKHFSTSPIGLGYRLIPFFDFKKVKWLPIYGDMESIFLQYLPAFKCFVFESNNLLIKESFSHEEILHKNSFLSVEHFREVKINLDSLPKINDKVTTRSFTYNILNLKRRSKKPADKSITYIAYLPGKFSQAIPLTPLASRLLDLCSGRRPIREMLQIAQKSGQITPNIILEYFRFFQKKGIINFLAG